MEHSCSIGGEECRTAYASRSPLESDDSWVGWPRVVEGLAAQIDSAER
jgi:hypothetical protein